MKTIWITTGLLLFAVLTGLAISDDKQNNKETDMNVKSQTIQKAMFAGGCFWCMEQPFEKRDGVISVTSGYSGGTTTNPTYENYSAGNHIEVIEVLYDASLVSYQELLDIFWRQVDPTDAGGQFVDRGHSYTTAIFYLDEQQKLLAETSKTALEKRGIYDKKIVTPIIPAPTFYPAEKYHQDYYKENPIRYKYYRYGSGRDKFLQSVWGKEKAKSKEMKKSDLKSRLTPLQYNVTQEEGTEPPFKNKYWDNKAAGIYVDIVSGEALFSSQDKFDSGTGWPSFTKPLVAENIVEKKDRRLFVVRTEVRSKQADSHLGHVFEDGPRPTGLRYCINSAALQFISKEDLVQEGYEAFVEIFN